MGEFFVYSTFFGVLLFLFPVFVSLDGYADVTENKFFFSVGLYRLFKVFGGYLRFSREGIIIHLTKKKAVILPYDKMTDTRKKFEITKGFQLYRMHQIIETGNVNYPAVVLLGALLQSVGGQVFSVLQTKHPFLSLKNSTLISEESALKITFQAVTVFNGLVLSMALSKKILEGMIAWLRRRKLILLWKKRQNA